MRGRMGLVPAAACALAAFAWLGTASAAEVTPSCPGPGPATCLLNDTQLESATGIDSDEYLPGDNATPADSQLATPFTIPAPDSWAVSEFDVIGEFAQFNVAPPPTGVNIWIYKDAGGGPGAEVLHIPNVDAPNGPNYVIPLPQPYPVLPPGDYWFSAQAAGVTRNSDMANYWRWSVQFVQPPLRSLARAAAPAPARALVGIGGSVVPPVTPPACPSVSADARYFKPRHPVKSTRLGVRVRVTANVPSNVTASARLNLAGGKTAELGTFTVGVPSFRKLRFPVPGKLHLDHGDKVRLLLHTVTTPFAVAGGCESDVRDYKIKTKVVNIEKRRAL